MYYRELARLTARLSWIVCGARLDRVTDAPCKLILSMTRYLGPEEGYKPYFLMIDFHPAHLDLYPVSRPPKASPVPQGFTMLLRKHLESQRLASVRLSEEDRIVTLAFGPQSCPRHALVVELTGHQSNVFLVDLETKTILGSVWRDAARRHAYRDVHDFYLPPPPPHALDKARDRFSDIPDDAYLGVLETTWTKRDAEEAFEDAKKGLQKRLKQQACRLERKIDALYRDLSKADDTDVLRREADLLAAYAWQLARGSREVRLPDFETGQPVVIALDPAISIRENIEGRYQRCRRAERALPMIEARLAEAEGQYGQVKEALTGLQKAASVLDIQAWETRLAPLLDRALSVRAGDTKKKPDAVHKPYKVFTSKRGLPIFVGKSAKDNDTLTFRIARGNDWWFHAAHVPGSHVVVRSSEPDQETWLDAATLAVHYSKLAHAAQAEVQATQKKNIRRIKGAPAGKVEIRHERILSVVMEADRLRRLLLTEHKD